MTMFTVAFIGPDGAGKTTISRHLEHTLPLPVKYIYMGVSISSSNTTLPTTRLIQAIKNRKAGKQGTAGEKPPADIINTRPRRKGLFGRISSSSKAALRLLVRMSEEWYRQGLSTYYKYRGYVVIYDRHFFADFYGFDIVDNKQQQPLSRRIHGFMLEHLYPKPDLVIYLDAPGKVLFARKGEKSPEILEDRRQKYIELCNNTRNCMIVDATRPTEQLIEDVTRMIMDFHNARNGA